MEDERNTQSYQTGEAAEKAEQVEVTDRGFFNNLVGKKEKAVEEKRQEEELAAGMEKVSVEEPEVKKEEPHQEGEKHESLFTKLHRSSSSSSSSSDEEEEEVIDDNGEVIKRKKKKGLKEKIKEKLPGHKDTEGDHVVTGLPAPAPPAALQTHHDTAVPVEKIDGDVKTEAPPAVVPEEEKKGFLEKIKEKLPGGHKKPEDAAAVPVTHAAPAPVHAPAPVAEEVSSPDGKEKKGILGKIMDKLPGYHKAAGEEDKAAGATAGEHKTSG